MTPEEIQAMAKGAFGGQALWYVLSACVGAAAAGFGAYLAQKGKNRAASEDFQEVLRQQRSTTEAVEQIKDVLVSKAWVRQRQWEAKDRHLSNLLRELAALELMSQLLLHKANEIKDLPIDHPSRHPKLMQRYTEETANLHVRLRAIAEAIGAAELYLPQAVVQPVRMLVRQEFESSIDHENLEGDLQNAREWIQQIGVVREAILECGRTEVGIS